MNEAFEKILKKIEEKRNKYQRLADGSNFDGWNEEDIKYSAKAEMCEELKEIVYEVAEEYHGGWIACSERLPEESGEYLTWVKYDGDRFIAIDEIDCNGIIKEWNCSTDYKIIVWQPLPKPFKERD